MADQVLPILSGLTAHKEVLVLEDLIFAELAILQGRIQQSERGFHAGSEPH